MSTNYKNHKKSKSLTLGQILTFARLHYHADNYTYLLNRFIDSNGTEDDHSTQYEISQIEVGRIINLSNETLSRYENDIQKPQKIEICVAIANFYRINWTDFVIYLTPEYKEYFETSANTYRNNISTQKVIELSKNVSEWISSCDDMSTSEDNVVKYAIEIARMHN